MKNIVLIGMPSCGKSSIGKKLARYLHMNFIDMDQVIIDNEGKSIPDMFQLYGESGFRDRETKAAKQVSHYKNAIIATGGGVILKEINMEYLKRNSTIIFINRNLDLLISDDSNRPLSRSKEALSNLYHQRIDLYHKYADYTVFNNHDFFECVERIMVIVKE